MSELLRDAVWDPSAATAGVASDGDASAGSGTWRNEDSMVGVAGYQGDTGVRSQFYSPAVPYIGGKCVYVLGEGVRAVAAAADI